MIFKHVGFGLLLRAALLFVMLNVTIYTIQALFYPQVITALLIAAAQLWELMRYLTRANTEMARYLLALRNRDFSLQFTEKITRSDLPQLHQAFNQINQTFTQLQIEKEAQFRLLQTILQIIDSGIIAYTETGEILWMNEAFKQILHLPHLRNIHALEKRQETFYQALMQLQPNSSELVKLKINQQPVQLLISVHNFKMQSNVVHLAALKNVSNTIDQTETEAWQKLLRVMTHEIMNSVAPIASLTDTMLKHLRRNKKTYETQNKPQPNQELLQDTEEVIAVIQNRSEGLLRFASIYRNLSKVTELHLTTVFVQELFYSGCALLKTRLQQEGINLITEVSDPELTLQADANLLEQVLINLILNAERAVKESLQPTIKLTAYKQENGQVIIEVSDNGTGIPEELLDSIFIPFFTSHKDGSGIGLSLAKQIITLHKGSIQVKSKEGEGTVFSLIF